MICWRVIFHDVAEFLGHIVFAVLAIWLGLLVVALGTAPIWVMILIFNSK